ncbi:hypothetical protein H5410_013338 [Solanum commersonii]|uniref:Uncharacterized protein n=1 Tax=Solanum commersonii TaxID=4109 RepID=A0A9J6AUB0_SOLCO|nr:hypothetical protein H5410_013338 [Solanum commersonii]
MRNLTIPNSPLVLPKSGASTVYALGFNSGFGGDLRVYLIRLPVWFHFTPVCLMSDDDVVLAAPGEGNSGER